MKRYILALMLVLSLPFAAHAAAEKESAYDRVMKTQTIRCGYGTGEPWIYRDVKTGKMTGVYIPIIERVAEQLGLKLEWPEETGWAELPTALATGRVDVACSSLWNDPARGRQVAFAEPTFYQPIYAVARADDVRFTGKKEEINNPDIRITVQEGDFGLPLAQRDFSKATLVTIPQQAPWTNVFLNITTGKADVTFIDAIAIESFNRNNEIKLKRIPGMEPVAIYGVSYAVGIKETAMKEMLNTAVRYMIQTGQIEELTADFRKQYPDAIILPKKPF